jgi:endonuclease G, mitochondrial
MRSFLILLLTLSICHAASLDNFLPAPGPGQVIHHHAYTLEFADQYKQPSWVCYMICRSRLEISQVPRTNDFRTDLAIRRTTSATPQDYSRSGYDKGHLAPSADFRWNDQAQSESFFMSNMSPQQPAFNRGIWKHLEEQVREWAKDFDTLYVVTGAVLKPGLPTIGTSNVAVPEAYYKIVLDYKPPVEEAIGFILRNEGSKEPLSEFAVSVDSVEKVTGIDFFPELPDSIETVVESRVNLAFWHLNGETKLSTVSSSQSIASKPLPPGYKRMKITRHKCTIDCPKEDRIGCACGDGTTSDNTGKGACAGHGGVVCWECR